MTDLDNYIVYLENKYENLRKSRNILCGVKEGLARQCMLYHNAKVKIKMKNIKMCINNAQSFKNNKL